MLTKVPDMRSGPIALCPGDKVAARWYPDANFYVGRVFAHDGKLSMITNTPWGPDPSLGVIEDADHVIFLEEGPLHQPPQYPPEEPDNSKKVVISIMQRQPDGELVKVDIDGTMVSQVGTPEKIAEMLLEAEMRGNTGKSRIHMFYS